ncbi:hypothetical protein LCGC14_1821590 [marine sediment metagenome]|uniref:Uncharacterized protein n=1 Tax=marine sediment metagenome TaxID=412755 RepID=A0A0F9IYH6_9ZZZZ
MKKNSVFTPLGYALNRIGSKRSHTDGRGFVIVPRLDLAPELVKSAKKDVKYYRVTGDIKKHLAVINERTKAVAIFSDNGFGDEFPEGNWITDGLDASALHIPKREAILLLRGET